MEKSIIWTEFLANQSYQWQKFLSPFSESNRSHISSCIHKFLASTFIYYPFSKTCYNYLYYISFARNTIKLVKKITRYHIMMETISIRDQNIGHRKWKVWLWDYRSQHWLWCMAGYSTEISPHELSKRRFPFLESRKKFFFLVSQRCCCFQDEILFYQILGVQIHT